jgi:C4-dicarboxylate transporter, DctQ subunit
MKWFNRLEEMFLSVILAAMALVTFANVISRYFLHASLSFTEEITTNLFGFAVFFGAALLARENGHLGFSLLTDLFPRKLKMTAIGLVAVLTAFFFCVLIYYGWDMIQQQMEYKQTTPAMGFPAWIMGLSIPLGGVLCLFRFTEGYVKEFNRVRREHHG